MNTEAKSEETVSSENGVVNLRLYGAEAKSQFNVAFGVMTIIPLLLCIYLVTVKFLSLQILVGINGIYFLWIVLFSLLGLLYGREVIQKILDALVEKSGEAERLIQKEFELNKALNTEIREKNKAQARLRRIHDQLVYAARMESVGQLAAGAAHEVKNPLAMLQMGIHYLQTRIGRTDQKTLYMLQRMTGAVGEADQVIRDLLDFANKTSLTIKPENLNTIIEQSLTLVKFELDKHHVRVVKHLDNRLPQIWVDKQKMQQIVINLITNAIHAMPKGGRLKVQTYAESTADKKYLAVLQVEDEGQGIPDGVLSRIYDPFFTTHREDGGTGLGLSVLKNLVDLHRGNVRIQNRLGEHGVVAKVQLRMARPPLVPLNPEGGL